MRLEFLKEMPKAAIKMRLDLTTLLDALFFTWTVQLLLPVSQVILFSMSAYSLSFSELVNKVNSFSYIGNVDIPCLREAAEAKTNDEDARAEGRALLADILRLFPGPFSSLHGVLHHLWVHHR